MSSSSMEVTDDGKEENDSIDWGRDQKIQTEMSGLQNRYDRLADRLTELQEEKRRRTSEEIMDAFEKSGKSYQKLMTFLKPWQMI